jgi:pimeloyl-ACP methyl ester carboxylesterase
LNIRINETLYSFLFVITAIVLAVSTSISTFNVGFTPSHTLFAQQPQSNFASAEPQLLTEGNPFKIDNITFSHHMASVNGIQLHYVIGGKGDPVVLLHGWPETWYAWRHVMPALAENYTVIAPDLRGVGDSSKPLSGYDGKTLAEDIHQLVTQLGFETIFLVAHDIGGPVAYAYAAEHPSEVKTLVVMDTAIPGFVPPPSWNGELPVWWVPFHQTPDVPEALVQGKETAYLSWHFQNLAYNQAAIAQADINEYVSHYSAPGGMRAGFEHYRAFPQDAIQNQNYSKTKLTMPVLAVGAGYIPLFGGNLTTSAAEYAMKILAEDVTGIIVPNSGHYIAEERPDFLVEQLAKFFGE